MKIFVLSCVVLALAACSENDTSSDTKAPEAVDKTASTAVKDVKAEATPLALDDVLAMQDEDSKSRYKYRNPKQTLEFFNITPGMTVVEALPGGGWYTKILAPYIGADGQIVGVDYDIEMWPNFSFVNDKFIEERASWSQTWPAKTQAKVGDDAAKLSAYTFATLPDDMSESADAVLFIRALHNLARFEEKGQYLSKALAETDRILKPGGVIGVVQHQADEAQPDDWADGSRGYLKQSAVVKAFTDAGFVLLKESTINANPKDKPGTDDIVWRLPPSYSTVKKDSPDAEKMRAEMDEIGESNRMTLLFQKPAAS